MGSRPTGAAPQFSGSPGKVQTQQLITKQGVTKKKQQKHQYTVTLNLLTRVRLEYGKLSEDSLINGTVS